MKRSSKRPGRATAQRIRLRKFRASKTMTLNRNACLVCCWVMMMMVRLLRGQRLLLRPLLQGLTILKRPQRRPPPPERGPGGRIGRPIRKINLYLNHMCMYVLAKCSQIQSDTVRYEKAAKCICVCMSKKYSQHTVRYMQIGECMYEIHIRHM